MSGLQDNEKDDRWGRSSVMLWSENELVVYAMDNNVVGGNQDGDRGKATRGRRTWLRIEEDALVQCLTDILNDG
ncbi:hypothetical protein ACS0TY_020616 [Phlomoides rotata]